MSGHCDVFDVLAELEVDLDAPEYEGMDAFDIAEALGITLDNDDEFEVSEDGDVVGCPQWVPAGDYDLSDLDELDIDPDDLRAMLDDGLVLDVDGALMLAEADDYWRPYLVARDSVALWTISEVTS